MENQINKQTKQLQFRAAPSRVPYVILHFLAIILKKERAEINFNSVFYLIQFIQNLIST